MIDLHRRGHLRAGTPSQPSRHRHHHPDFEKLGRQAWRAIQAEGQLPNAAQLREQQWALEMGLPGAESLKDRTIPTFARGENSHFAGINTFLKAPYVEKYPRCRQI